MRREFFPLPQNTTVTGVCQKAQMRNRNYPWVEFSISPTPFLGLDIGNFPKPVKCLADYLSSSYPVLSFSCPHLLFFYLQALYQELGQGQKCSFTGFTRSTTPYTLCLLSLRFLKWGDDDRCEVSAHMRSRKMENQQLKFFSNLVIKKGTRVKTPILPFPTLLLSILLFLLRVLSIEFSENKNKHFNSYSMF